MELNEQTLEQILTRQREEYQRYLDAQGVKYERHLEIQREEYQRYVGVIAEHFDSQVKLIAETLGEMQRQLAALRDMVARNTEDIEIMKMELSVIRSDLKEKIGRDEFAVLESRVAKLERTSRGR